MFDLQVRAVYQSVRVSGLVAPNDTAHLKIYYQAEAKDTDFERNTGLLPCIEDGALKPIVILMPGINVGPEGFGWLAQNLCQRGLVVVTYSLIGEELAGQVSLTPGIDISALGPDRYGKTPSALALAAILQQLGFLNASGMLAGRLDLSKIVLGGHSAGGTVALLNANSDWFPGIVGAFSYGAHTAAATMLGHAPGTMNAIPSNTPVMILGGTNDGVIAESAARYGDRPGDATGRVVATFTQAVSRAQGDCVLVILEGANHFSIINPQDTSTGRGFLDGPETNSTAGVLIETLIWAFISEVVGVHSAESARAAFELNRNQFSIIARK